jgi:hypothetical protein
MCIANLITNFYKTSLWWKYCKLQCECARKVVKGLLEQEVSQNAMKKMKNVLDQMEAINALNH